MKKMLLIFGILIIAVGGFVLFINNNDSAIKADLLAKCYHGKVGDSDSVFTVNSQKGDQVEGQMAFVFAQKDSSYGTYKGTYKSGEMKVAYKFWSEGVESVGDYSFIKKGENFAGSGYIYQPATDCETYLNKQATNP